MIDLRSVTAGTGLDVTAAISERSLTACFTGSAEMQAFDALKQVVATLHAEVLEQQLREVTVDFKRLDFMSSSCFKCLVSWIADIADLPADAQYRIRFLSSTDHLWQRRSLHVLQTFATDLVAIET